MASVMTFQERLETVLSGGVPDRVPCIPLIYYFAASFAGVGGREFLTSMRSYRRAIDTCYWEAGPFDAMYPLPITMDAPRYDLTMVAALGLKPVLPDASAGGPQLLQTPETETLMEPDDYARIAAGEFPRGLDPMTGFMVEMIARHHGCEPGLRLFARRFVPDVVRLAARWVAEMRRWRSVGVPFFASYGLEAPFDTFSMARGLTGFAVDLRYRGEEIREAALKMARVMSAGAAVACRATRTNRFLLLLHRSSNDFISPRQFKDIAFPAVREMAGYLDARGIVFCMHCDGNWDRNLEVMADLPENSCFQFDGCTDIFRAREILGERFTLMGDVASTMLAYGEPDEVEEYCRRVIAEVGANGHFILSSGCEIPSNAKPGNVKAMVAAVRRHGHYR